MNRKLVWLIAATTAVDAVRAGAGTFRVLLDLPARASLGPVAFAAFSRATDLSTAGIAFYAFYGFGGAAMTGTTWIVATRTRAPVVLRRLGAVAFAMSLLILACTTQAAPLMFRVGSASNDPVLLARLLDRFTAWTLARIVCADVSFAAMLLALTLVALRASVPERRP